MKAVLFASSPNSDINAEIAFKNNLEATAAPTVNDDSSAGYEAGSQWVYNQIAYICVSAAAGAAVWLPTTEGDVDPGQVAAPAASTPTGIGGAASITGGAGGSTSGAGGSSGTYGGAATAGNSNGGAAYLVGGAKTGTGRNGATVRRGYVNLTNQGAPATQDTAATLTVAQIVAGIVQTTPGGAINLQLPLAADLDTALPEAIADDSFDFSIINTSGGANTATVTTNTGWGLVGAMGVAQNVSGRFRARRTGAGAWSLYRVG